MLHISLVRLVNNGRYRCILILLHLQQPPSPQISHITFGREQYNGQQSTTNKNTGVFFFVMSRGVKSPLKHKRKKRKTSVKEEGERPLKRGDTAFTDCKQEEDEVEGCSALSHISECDVPPKWWREGRIQRERQIDVKDGNFRNEAWTWKQLKIRRVPSLSHRDKDGLRLTRPLRHPSPSDGVTIIMSSRHDFNTQCTLALICPQPPTSFLNLPHIPSLKASLAPYFPAWQEVDWRRRRWVTGV